MTRLLAHSIRLPLVLRHASVNRPTIMSVHLFLLDCLGMSILHNVRADWRLEDGGQRVRVLAGLSIAPVDGDGRSARHFRRWSCGVVQLFLSFAGGEVDLLAGAVPNVRAKTSAPD